MSSLHNSDNMGDEQESTQLSELDSLEQYKELEQIYNKLIVTNGKVNYGPPMQRTLIPGAHARKLGIRLKTAKQLSEKRQESRERLKTAAPRLELSSQERVDEMISPIPTDRISRTRVSTAFVSNSSPQRLSKLPDRTPSKSAPPAPRRVHENTKAANKMNELPNSANRLPSFSSLAMYSPQTQRFTMEQLAMEQTRALKRLSNIQTHRVEKKFYVSGAPCDLKDRYNIDEEQYTLLMDITNKGKSTNKQLATMNLSKSVLQHFSPQLTTPRSLSRPPMNQKAQGKRVSLQINSRSRQDNPNNKQSSPLPGAEAHKTPLQVSKDEPHEHSVQVFKDEKLDTHSNHPAEVEEPDHVVYPDLENTQQPHPSMNNYNDDSEKLVVEAENISPSESEAIGDQNEKREAVENDATTVDN